MYVNENGSYNEELIELLEDKYDEWKKITFEERAQLVNNIIDEYVYKIGDRPPNNVLNKLTDLYLYDHLEGDTRSNKRKVDDYPILSDLQYERITRGHTKVRNAYGLVFKEVGLSDITYLASDGIDHRIARRRKD